ncbi:MAG: hypothetical protein UHM08_09130 [Bacteroidales bacterium]|nr:hypothetical protein [Bacteroidales bacterium]
MTKFLNISVDNTLGGNSPSDEIVSSQKAVKEYIDTHSGGSSNIDNITITTNADDEIQAVGTINQNTATGATNPIKSWLGDINEYNNQSVPTSNPDALCFIVDKTQTATDRYIVEAQYPDDTNGYTWYFLYSDGWVEQGGLCSGTAENNPVTMPIEMSNTEYQILAIADPTDSVNSWGWIEVARNTKTTTGFSLGCRHSSGSVVPVRTHWQVSGMAA